MPCRRNKSTETIYKEVVVVGNGPSAISLSYMLAGHVPYYEGTSSDEMLHARLSEFRDKPLVLQDLQLLSDGLEGRSTNPVSVLFDALSHPDADTGFEQPSLLEWRNRPDLAVDHVVLGKGKAGGAWKSMSDSNMLTVSFGTWMELPNLKMYDWKPSLIDNAETRVTVATVAQYYQDYVRLMSLQSHFEDDVVVTTIRKITEFSSEDCTSVMTSHNTVTLSRHSSLPDIASTDDNCVTVTSFEENAIFEHEASLYGHSDVFNDRDVIRHSVDSGTVDDDELTVGSGSGGAANVWNDGDSLCSSSNVTSGSSAENGNQEETIYDDAVVAYSPRLVAADFEVMRQRALSGTRMGQFMQNQAQRCANISCCLELAKCCGQEDGVLYNLSWNPIVHPTLFGCSVQDRLESQSAPRFPSGRSYSWSSANRLASYGRRRPSTTCPVSKCFPQVSHLWEVTGYRRTKNEDGIENSAREEFRYLTKNVVLATGSYDRPNLLHVSGENLPFVFHSLRDFESLLASKQIGESEHPVMIVGAGLSAADAIIAARQQRVQVVHVFRRDAQDPSLIFNNLPRSLYPEYHKVHRLMMSKERDEYYQPMEKNHIVKILENGQVKLHGETACRVLKVSHVVVLVGSSPDLDFLDENSGEKGIGLGILPGQPISRNNPIDIDLFTHESIHQRGLYAMGPLVGDNFVRFLQGGALAITSNIIKTNKKSKLSDRDGLS